MQSAVKSNMVCLSESVGTVGTEHAAIAGQRFKLLSATLAYIEELTGVGRHLLDRLVPALGASKFGIYVYQRDCTITSWFANCVAIASSIAKASAVPSASPFSKSC